MCGRFALTSSPQDLGRSFGFDDIATFPPRYNIAPTQPIVVVAPDLHGQGRRARLMRWGFLPGFVKDPRDFPLLFNARSEGLLDKASFRNAARRRRCLVPADAFYEWRRLGGGGKAEPSQAYLFARADGAPLALAGLWESWAGPNGEEVDTVCIVTTGANGMSAAIHPRLPVVIEAQDMSVWLDPDEGRTDRALALCRPAADAVLVFTPLGDAVNAAANDHAGIQRPLGPSVRVEGGRRPATPRSKARDEEQPSLF